ncbi:hypothetical protein OUZ56_013395 [Daphnia magna]|uniref:3-keto-disaccharide hydrolase domain-containing protein n=1 Tax=Daphnia magna TaxID=35525 RepID=A0ABQ9Z5T5_9CRUS|nr:hypothetical protein OUZ56_013395 [Daphnia magna]
MQFSLVAIISSLFVVHSANAILLPLLAGILSQHRRLPEPLPPLSFLLMQHYLSRNVTIQNTVHLGHSALKVVYTGGRPNFDTGLMPSNSYVELPLTTFYEGTIDVDIAAERNNRITEPARAAAAGIAFRIQSKSDQYELVCLRMANGRFNLPPPSTDRLGRAIQYTSLPEWTADTLRNQFPGRYEAAAKIGERRWNHVRICVRNNTVCVFIDGHPTPVIQSDLLGTNARGSFAYWVDAGTNAYFANLRIVET